MRSYIIITSINKPTAAVKAFAHLPGHKTIVVGDAKTPSNWSHRGVDYYSLKNQYIDDFSSAKLIPENNYSRKNLGYLKAVAQRADLILDTDDDNIPYADFEIPAFEGAYDCPQGTAEWVNIYKYFTDAPIWPRGFPLDQIHDHPPKLSNEQTKVVIWQGLADKDPDVDAIYRLTSNKEVIFEKRAPVVLREGTYCPLNSQNTTFTRETFPLLYLPHTVSFRFTDILRGLVALTILRRLGQRVGFHSATVYQERNPHNLLADFKSEIPCYIHAESVPTLVADAVNPSLGLKENLLQAYEILALHKIVAPAETETLKAWLSDLVEAGYEA